MIRVEELYPLIIEAFNANKSFNMPIKGTSMEPLLHTGDIVELYKIDEIKKNDIIFYIRDNHQFVLHRVYRINKDNTIDFIGDHQVTIEHGIRRDQCFAKVISFERKNKKHYPKGFLYKLYLLAIKSFLIRRVYIKCLH